MGTRTPVRREIYGYKSLTPIVDRKVEGADKKPSKDSAERKPARDFGDFGNEYAGREVLVLLHDGMEKRGLAEEVRRFFIKLRTGGEVLFINKAYVVFVKIVDKQSTANGEGERHG